jgi:predicted acetyltransferase
VKLTFVNDYELNSSTKHDKRFVFNQLLLILDVMLNIKIPKVMIACDKENTTLAKTVLSCSGILTF